VRVVAMWGDCACVKPRTPCHRLASGRVEKGFIWHKMQCE